MNTIAPGAWMTDAINFTHDMDVYQQWASMVAHNQVAGPFPGKYYTGYASRKFRLQYQHNHDAILKTWGSKIVRHGPIDKVFRRAMGDFAYQFRAETLEEVREIATFIQVENL